MPAQPKPRGPGRPTVAGLDRRTPRNISLPESLWQQLDTAAARDGLPLSTIVERRLTKSTTTTTTK